MRPEVLAAWLTSWDIAMRRGRRFPGADWTTVTQFSTDVEPPVFDIETAHAHAGDRSFDGGWTKWWALDLWLARRPEIDTVVWCDDDLTRSFFASFDDYDVDQRWALTWQAFVSKELDRRGLRALLIAPDKGTGVTPEHLESIGNFLDDTTTRSLPVMLTAPRYPSADDISWRLEKRRRRVCGQHDPASWYLRYAPFIADCATCGRSFFGPHDITDHVPCPPSPQP